MDTIAATIERLVKREYGRPAPQYFQRAMVKLLQVVSKAMRESLEAEARKGEDSGDLADIARRLDALSFPKSIRRS